MVRSCEYQKFSFCLHYGLIWTRVETVCVFPLHRVHGGHRRSGREAGIPVPTLEPRWWDWSYHCEQGEAMAGKSVDKGEWFGIEPFGSIGGCLHVVGANFSFPLLSNPLAWPYQRFYINRFYIPEPCLDGIAESRLLHWEEFIEFLSSPAIYYFKKIWKWLYMHVSLSRISPL